MFRDRKLSRSMIVAAAITCTCTCAAGCLPLDRINRPPRQPLITGPDRSARGQANVMYEATSEDPDGELAELSWARTQGACPSDAATLPASARPVPERTGASFEIAAPSEPTTLCIWVVAQDRNGAESVATKQVEVVNAQPEARIDAREVQTLQAMSDWSLYEEVRLTAARSVDPDAQDQIVTYSWQVAPPQGPAFSAQPCADGTGPEVLCFMPGAPGPHVVSLVVFDNLGGASQVATHTAVVAPDSPPCLRDTDQSTDVRLRRFDETVTFNVTVSDDGDPYPPRDNALSKLRLAWSVRKLDDNGGAFVPFTGLDQAASLRIPGNVYRQGDEVQVRVEAFDRAHDAPWPCPVETDICETRATCKQRLTFTVRYWL